MSLRILFADDSVTAQNMGKKILTEAGYEVVAVSNGAAAVKKIAEQKPDIIILDVYMPGYSGLEVCEKVRASMATIKTPVLLTVGKMEPYRPEDARRVRADGVIIKPFEASDLLAIVKKFEERIGQIPPPLVQPPPPRPVEEIEVAQPERSEHHEPHAGKNLQPTVDVPDHMATASAFSDLLGGDQAHAVAAPPPPPPVEQAAEPARHVPESEIPVSWRQDVEPQPIIVDTPVTPVITAAPVAESAPVSEPEPISEPSISEASISEPQAPPPPVAAEAPPVIAAAVVEPEADILPEPIPRGPVLGRPRQIPVYQEPEASGIHEVVPTAAGPIGDIDIPREPQLQESAEEITRETVAEIREPQLVTASQMAEPAPMASAAQSVTVAAPAAVEQVVSHPSPVAVAETAPVPRREVSDVDFEARVAAALKAYQHVPAPESLATAAAVEPPPVPQETAVPAPSFEYRPPVSAPEPPPVVAEPAAAVAAPVPEPVHIPEPAPVVEVPKAEPVAASTNHDAVVAKLDETLPAAAAAVASATGAEHDSIAEAVSRVMERMKGDLVDEIVRELKTKK